MGLIRKFSLLSLAFLIFLLSFSLAFASNNAQFVRQSVPSYMIAGQSYTVLVTMKNTGTTTWTASGNYRLGSQNPQDNWNWGLGRVNLASSESIAPGQTKTFTFTVKPQKTGNLNFQWRMVQDYVEWFGGYSANSIAYVRTIYLQVLSSGQSLSIGGTSSPALSKTQPYNNVMLSPNVEGAAGPLIPLVENFYNLETPSSGIANSLRAYDSLRRPVAVGLHGVGGTAYDGLKKGTAPYENGIKQAKATKALVEAGGNIYRTVGVTIVHGESDYWAGNSVHYEGYLKQWQNDYQTDINTITGTASTLPMFINQMSTGATGHLAVAQLNAHRNSPGKIILVGPKYQYGYSSDHLHLTNTQSKHMGEMFAKAIKRVYLEGKTWNPLMPTSVVRRGNIITISYAIPVGTLAIDTKTVARRPNYGFEFVQTGGTETTISSVQLVNGNTQVQLTLNRVPDGTNQKVMYAWRCYAGNNFSCGNAADGTYVGGNIRDTDNSVSPAIGSTRLPLYDWGVTFDEPVTFASVQNGQKCASSSECSSGNCINTYCCNAGQCGGVASPMCFSNGQTASNQWFSGICKSGQWRTVLNGIGCNIFPCDQGTCVNNICISQRTSGLPNEQRCANNSQCTSGFCSNTVCCSSGQCGWGAENGSQATCVDNGGTKQNQWASAVCRNGQWNTVLNRWGCNIFPCDQGACLNNTCVAGLVCMPDSVSGCRVCNIQGTAWTDDNSRCSSGQICVNGQCTYGNVFIQSPYTSRSNVYRGQLHAHSRNSDGIQSPYALAAAYRNAGYDFISITDHNRITSSPGVPNIIFIPGVETSLEGNHINIINASAVPSGTVQSVIDQAVSGGSFVFLNHPNWPGGYPANASWTDAELESARNYNGIEVWNSAVAPNQNAEARIDYLLSRDRRFYLVATDDSHNVNSASSKTASVRVFSDRRTLADIMINMRNGNFYASNGANILSVMASGETITITTDSASRIDFITRQGVSQSSNNVNNASYRVLGNESYIRVSVTRNSDGRIAWTNPFYVCQNECTLPEQRQCSGNGFQTCSDIDSDSCLEWSSVTDCSENQTCTNGQCITNNTLCTPDSVSGCRVCNQDGTAWIDDNSRCATGQICQNGTCIANCSDECSTANQTQCSGNGFQTCSDSDSDSCLEWSAVTNCAANQNCTSGQCVNQTIPSLNLTCPQNCTINQSCTCTVSDCSEGLFIVRNIQGQPINITMMIMSGDFPLTFFSSSPYERSFTPTANGTVSAVAVCLEAGKVKAQSRQIQVT